MVLDGFHVAVENIHSETYLLLIDTSVKDQAERLDGHCSVVMPECMITFAAIEGVFFTGSLCASSDSRSAVSCLAYNSATSSSAATRGCTATSRACSTPSW
ncbi:hypothetical protein ACHAWF_007298 [Thalassiosira exigua]